ncbi:MAG: PIG-L family deacetylase [Caulobacteraceae bacterium]|nr:PIG-L family deacetylase [Caulobacteraceae bacterium]
MLALDLARPGKTLRVLALGAHSDDIEIGAGGAILSWIASGAEVSVDWCALSAPGERADEARASAMEFLAGAKQAEIHLGEFRDGYFPAERTAVKDWVEGLKRLEKPDVVLCHQRNDAHQDHRMVCELAWNTFRDHLILEYEIPKWDGDLGQPNIYVPLSEEVLARKIELLHKHFGTQRSKAWFDDETFRGLARLRGVECRERYAEAFFARKLLLK